jgi:hypothetical protein
VDATDLSFLGVWSVFATLRPTNIELYAANGTKIPVLGGLRLNFTAQGKPLHADLLVSDAVEDNGEVVKFYLGEC